MLKIVDMSERYKAERFGYEPSRINSWETAAPTRYEFSLYKERFQFLRPIAISDL